MGRKVRWLVITLFSALCLAVTVAGCGRTQKPSVPDGGLQEKPAVKEITLSGMRTEFAYGEAFTYEGLVVTVVRENGESYRAKKSEYEVDSSAYDAEAAGEQEITVTLINGGIFKKYAVTVAEPVPVATELALSGMATEFEYGQAFSAGGLTVTVTLSNGTDYAATSGEYEVDSAQYDAYTAGEYEICVKLKNTALSKTYTVTVKEEPVYSWEDDGVLKILTIGNSFSDDTMQYAWQIADSLGVKEIYLGNLYIGGCTLDTHASNAANDSAVYEYRVNSNGTWSTTKAYRMGDAIASCDWDFVSLQQASGSSGIASTYGKVQQLIDYVRSKLPKTAHAKIVWNMTWAYQSTSTHAEFSKYGNSQETMYSKIVEAVQSNILTNKNIAAVIPCGTAIQNARTSYLGDSLTRDGYHLTLDMGRYIAGLTLVHALTGLSVENIAYIPSGVAAEDAKIATESASNVVKTSFAVTPSKHTQESLFDAENYTALDYNLTLGFYNSTEKTNYAGIIADNASLSPKFYATKRFTPEELPVGTVITIASGWQYRPEYWKSDAVQSARPDNVTTRIVTVTPEWWNGCLYRAFNISKVGLPVIEGKEAEAKSALKIYLPKASAEAVLAEMGYTKLAFDLTQGFYNSTDNVNYATVIANNSSLSPKFYATKRFTQEELPVGTVLLTASGWQYRPEYWKEDAAQANRPANVKFAVTVIDAAWWEGYLYRAFNLGKTDSSSIAGQEAAARAAFAIYVPNAE